MNTTILNTKISKVENKILDHAKYITTQEFNKLIAENVTAKLKQANIVTKTDYNNKLTKYLEVQKKLNSLITNDYTFFLGGIYFQVMMDLKTCLFINH